MNDLACVVHVHSTFSDGTATVDEIIEAAREADVDAVLLTDHDTLGARHAGLEGRHGSVLLLVGTEISPKGGHFLAFGLEREIPHEGLSEREISAAVQREGALGFPAHPFSRGSAISKTIGRPHGWNDLEGSEYTGIELWSLMTEAAERCSTLRELAAFVRRPERFVDGPPARNLATWDRLCLTRRVVAIGGLDAHQTGIRTGGRALSPHPHSRVFRTLRTHVLTAGPPGPDTVYAALREGQCYLSVDALADARGFRYWAEGQPDEVAMGEQAPAGRWTLRARLPEAADILLVRDGRPVVTTTGRELEHVVDGPGVFRLEAHRDGRAWIISNPIYLR